MAKYKISGKKVTGTKKKDKITWQNKKAWKKNLTVDAGAGNDIIDFTKSGKTNTFIGGKGKDTIKTGKGKSTIVINKGDGNDTIYNNSSKTTTIKFNKPNAKDKITACEKRGNDLIITFTHAKVKGDKKEISEVLTFKDYYKEDGTIAKDNIYIQSKKTAKLSALISNLKITAVNGVFKGTDKSETLTGTNGKDTIYANGGNDTIYGNGGDDVIYVNKGTNTVIINRGDGNDIIYHQGERTNLQVNSAKEDDTQSFEKKGDDLLLTYTHSGTTTNEVLTLKNYFTGNQNIYLNNNKIDTLLSLNGIKIDGSGNILGTKYNNTITGGIGADNIEGGDGDDIITGGQGNDTINAGAGNNTMIFSEGDGSNTIISGNGTDTVYLTRDLSYYQEERIGNDLVLYYSSTSDEDNIVLKDFFTADHSVKFIGAEGDPTSAIENFYINVNGEGTIDGTRFTEYIYGSDGVDIITAGDAYAEYDFADAGEGNDIINIQNNGSMYLDIYNEDGNDTVNNVANANKLYIWHSYDATVYGYQDGSDYKIVREYTVNGEKQTATTTLTDFVLADHPNIVQMHYNSNYTNLTAFDLEGFTSNSTLIRVPDNNTLGDTSNDNLYILGSNAGDTITTGTGNDVISAGNGNNNITSTGGNNRILAGTGNDTITVNGSGDNYIEVASSSNYPGNVITVNSSGENTIKGGTYYDKIEINDGTNFIYANGGRDTITLNGGENYVEFNDNNNSAQVIVKTGDATIHGGSNNGFYGTTYIEGSSNTVNMTGSDNIEEVYIKSGVDNNLDLGAGNDKVTINTGASTNTIYTGTGEDTVSVYEDAGDETSVTIYGGDSMNGYADTHHNYYSIGAGTAEIHTGSYGDRVSIYGENATAVIYGNDNFASGQGDSINAIGSAGVTVYGGANGMNTLTGSYNDDSLVGGDSKDTITSNGGDDIINAGGGDDYIRNDRDTVAGNVEITGGTGNDLIEMNNTHKETLIFNNGDGNDIIRDSRTSAEGAKQDILKFADSNLSDLVLRIDPNNSSNIIIKYNNGQDSVKLESVTYYNDSDVTTSIAKVVTLDNPSGISFDEFLATRSVYDYSDETSGVNFSGTKFSDSIIGSDYGDTFWAGNYTGQDGGNDYIDAGAGNDSIRATFGNNTIIGGTGDDTISMANWTDGGVNTAIFNTGDGMDKVQNFGEGSVLKFGTSSLNNINIQSVYEVYDSYGNAHTRTLITFNNNPADGVILDQGYLDDNNKNAVIGLTESDDTITLGELINNRHIYLANEGAYRNVIIAYPEEFVPTQGGDTIPNGISTEYADHIYISGNFNTIEGGKGNDTIEAIGQIGDDGSLENVRYNKYVINVDEYGNGDGTDTIVNDNTWGWNAIMVKGVGTDVSDTAAQQAFLDNLHCDFVQHDEDDGYDLVIDYATNGRLIFKNVSKEDLSGMSTGQIGFIYPDAEGKYDYSSNYDDATRKYYSNFASYLNIPVNIPSGESYEANPNYSEVITGTAGGETLILNGGEKTISLKEGSDTIIVRSNEYSGDYTVNMSDDDHAPDVIWFKDITDPSKLSASRDYLYDENGNPIHDEHYNYSYSNDLVLYEIQNRNARIVIKDYFTHALVDNEPTFMTIKYGETGADTISIKDFISTIRIDNSKEQSPLVAGTCFDDMITPAAEIAEIVMGGKGNDTIEAYYHDNGTYGNPGADSVYGDDGNDSITYRDYYNPDVEIYGGDGNDEINITSGTAYGGAGSDELYAYGCNDHSHVEDDSYHYHEVALYGYSHIYEDPTDDGSVGDKLYSGDKNDTLIGSKGNDSIYAGGGNDIIRAGSGDDIIQASDGDDYIEGGDGNDTIYTVESSDNYSTYESYTSYRQYGKETVDGGAGNDTILAQGDSHTITGGQGDDLIVVAADSTNEYHFRSGDGHDVLHTATSSSGHDKVVFDNLVFDGENVKVELYENATYDYPANTLVIFYDKNGDNWNSSIQVRNYMSSFNYQYTSSVNSRLDRLVDQNGDVIYIRDLIDMNLGTVTDSAGTIFNDTATLADDEDVYAFEGNYGNDSVTGNNDNNNLYGYDDDYQGWGVIGDGNDYLDGKYGRNKLYGGWGNDTLVGGYNAMTDTMYGGYGANTYDIQRAYSDRAITAEIHSSSDKDTLILPKSQFITFANYDYDLLIDFKLNSTSNSDQILLYNWYSNPRDFRIENGNNHTTLFDEMKSAAPNGVEFGNTTSLVNYDTENTNSEKIYLGTSGDDRMYAKYSTTVNGGYGDDTITVNTGSSTVYGGEGNDSITGSNGAEIFYGGDGRDSIIAYGGNDLIYTASPTEFYQNWDPITEKSYYRMFEKYERADSTDNRDFVNAGAGNDTILAIGENSNLYGGAGHDTYHLTLDNQTYISDTEGTNNIVLHSFNENVWGESVYLVMDIDVTNTLNGQYTFYGDYGVLLMDYDGYRYWLNNECDLSDYKGGYIELSPVIGVGQYGTYTHQNIGTITNTYSQIITGDQISELKADIGSWFSGKTYTSVSDVLANGTEDDKTSLIAYFENFQNNAWHYND